MDWPAAFDLSGLPVAAVSLPAEWLGLSLVLAGLILFLLARVLRALRAVPAPSGATILVDGSNVMHWDSETPSLEPLRALLADLQERGMTPGVVFDANVGYKIGTR